jgi:hypothetical protein
LTARAITESTPVSIALSAAIVLVAFKGGSAFERLTRVEQTQTIHTEWISNSTNVLVELKEITKDHERRLQAHENARASQ